MGLKTTEIYSNIVLEARNSKSRAALSLGRSILCLVWILVAVGVLGWWPHHASLCLQRHIASPSASV